MNSAKIRIMIFSVLGIAVVAGMAYLYQTGTLSEWLGGGAKAEAGAAGKYPKPELIDAGDGEYGLKLSMDAVESLELNPKAAVLASNSLALPPMIGTVNYDYERLFSIKPLFTGKVTEFKMVPDEKAAIKIKDGSPEYKPSQRPIKFGDKVEQGEMLVVFWSRDLGEKKAALVDGLCSLKLSQDTLERQHELYKEGAISYAALKLAERQVQADKNTVWTAERTLRMWELKDKEIEAIKNEANTILTQKLERDVKDEANRWARVEIKAPVFDESAEGKKRRLTILEKNTSLNDMVDPANYGVPMFKIADLSRLQIWVHPPEEYLPILQKKMSAGPHALKWKIRFQAESTKLQSEAVKKTEELVLPVEQISPSLEPNQHTPMLIGYLPNPNHTYLIGQFVTATILAQPPADTVEIPTDAVNPVSGQEFVFIEKPGTKNEFLIRRVSVALSLKRTSYVRTILTEEQERINRDVKEGEYKIQPLKAGDRVVTRGVVEMTAALEEARNAKKYAK